MIVGAFFRDLRAMLWIPSFAVMGVACLVNARGCGRRHCHVTGPLFLLASIASALDAAGVVDVGTLFVLVVVGVGTLIAYAFEWWRGAYIETPVP